MPRQEPMEVYEQLQPLVKQDIKAAMDKAETQRQYSSVKTPVHEHTGTDSLKVNVVNIGDIEKNVIVSTIELSTAQVRALNTTAIELVPQPGLRTVIIVEGITARLVFTTAAYTGANAMEFRYTDASGTKVTADIPASFINSASSAFYHAPAVTAAFAPIEGGDVNRGRIVVSVPTANPGAGDSPIYITIKYRIAPFRA